MTGSLNAKSEALKLHELSVEALDAVAGGSLPLRAYTRGEADRGDGGAPAQMFAQLMQQLTQGF